LNPGRRGGKPATNSLIYGAAILLVLPTLFITTKQIKDVKMSQQVETICDIEYEKLIQVDMKISNVL
jgi:hypothetical protein